MKTVEKRYFYNLTKYLINELRLEFTDSPEIKIGRDGEVLHKTGLFSAKKLAYFNWHIDGEFFELKYSMNAPINYIDRLRHFARQFAMKWKFKEFRLTKVIH